MGAESALIFYFGEVCSMLWTLIAFASLVLLALCFIYIGRRTAKLISAKRRIAGILIGTAVPLALFFGLTLLWDMVNAIIVIIHLAVFGIICDFAFWIFKKFSGKDFSKRYSSAIALAVTVCYLSAGWYLLHNVWQTDYRISTDKPTGKIRIVQFADSHVGTSFSGKELENHIEKMNRLKPDIMLITGDFVDDDTSKRDMIDACHALSNADTKYGVYFAFGNHDKGYYDSSRRGYDAADLAAELEKNGVTVLEDESVLIDNRFYIVGRNDASEVQRGGSRTDAGELISGLDAEKYIIVMDHQPVDYKNESQTAADLVLSGHTHGGQLIPIMLIDKVFGINDRTYGTETRNGTDFIVTSGISDWAIKFKTGCKSEYNVIDID